MLFDIVVKKKNAKKNFKVNDQSIWQTRLTETPASYFNTPFVHINHRHASSTTYIDKYLTRFVDEFRAFFKNKQTVRKITIFPRLKTSILIKDQNIFRICFRSDVRKLLIWFLRVSEFDVLNVTGFIHSRVNAIFFFFAPFF